jgi:DNA-directed RNA polymerase subunit RPC12/RpoP
VNNNPFEDLLTTYFIVTWLVLAVVASLVAPADRSGTFFWTTLLFLGPLGLMAALIAQPRPRVQWRPLADGRRRIVCVRCWAEQDVLKTEAEFRCWQCGEVKHVKAQA